MFEPLADLERHAAERPDAVALATPGREYTFDELRVASRAVSARLHRAGIAAGNVVALDLPVALEWIVDLALFRLGAITVSVRGVTAVGDLTSDALLTEPGVRTTTSPLVIEVDELWIDNAVAHAEEPPELVPFAGPEAIFRLILTSGTTGSPRAAAYSVGALAYRSAEQHVHWTDGRPELTMIGLSTTGGFHAAIACLRLGTTYLAIDSITAASVAFAAAHRIRVLCGSPLQVASAIRVMVDEGITFDHLELVRLAGAGPSPAALQLMTNTFHVPVLGVYGSTEGGGISMLVLDPSDDRFAIGAPLPGVELEIVGGDGTVLPHGTEGLLRYRTPGLVSGYVLNGTVIPFADGWFIPGDLGSIRDDGTIVLGGRDSELLNLGGVKIDPVTVDDLATEFPGVRDAAAFYVERRAGLPEVGLAVAADESCDLRQLDRQLREKLPVGHPTAYWLVGAVPRNRLGKPMRQTLAVDYAREVTNKG